MNGSVHLDECPERCPAHEGPTPRIVIDDVLYILGDTVDRMSRKLRVKRRIKRAARPVLRAAGQWVCKIRPVLNDDSWLGDELVEYDPTRSSGEVQAAKKSLCFPENLFEKDNRTLERSTPC